MGMRKEFADMTERDIQEKLDQRYPDEHFDVVLKCVHACRSALMTECGSRAELEWARGQTCIRVMCICENGRHKSVAVATALQAVYLKMGFNSLGPRHMSLQQPWSYNSHYWQTCKDLEEHFTFMAHHCKDFAATRAAARANPSHKKHTT